MEKQVHTVKFVFSMGSYTGDIADPHSNTVGTSRNSDLFSRYYGKQFVMDIEGYLLDFMVVSMV